MNGQDSQEVITIKKFKILFFIGSLILCSFIVLILTGQSGMFHNKGEVKKSETNIKSSVNYGNIRNGGLIAQNKEWIYFSNHDDKDALYRRNIYNNDIEKLNDTPSDYITICQDIIYYRQVDELNISKMNLDGSDSEIILNGTLGDLFCVDDKLYFDKHKEVLYAFDCKQKELIKIYDGTIRGNIIEYPMIDGENIYFLDYDGLRMINSNATNLKKIYNDKDFSWLVLDNHKIYFSDGYKIGYVDLRDNSIHYEFEARENEITNLVILNGLFFYSVSGDIVCYSLHNKTSKTFATVEGDITSFGIVENGLLIEYSQNNELKQYIKIYKNGLNWE